MRRDTQRSHGLTLVPGSSPSPGPRGVLQSAAAPRSLRVRAANQASSVSTPGEWQVDLVPLAAPLDSPNARIAIGLVVDSSGEILAGDVLPSAPSETEDVVAAIAGLLELVARRAGAWPSLVRVRHPAVRAGLAPLLGRHGTLVKTARKLPRLDRVRRDFAVNMLGFDDPDLVAVSTGTWSSWGLDPDEIRRLFAAVGVLWSAEPWRSIPPEQGMTAVIPLVSRWELVLLGTSPEMFAVAILESGADVDRLIGSARAAGQIDLNALQGMALILLFLREAELPRDIRSDVKRNRWPIVDNGIVPVLQTVNTPAGGVTRRQVGDLTLILQGVAGFSRALEAGKVDFGKVGLWTDPDTGMNVIFDPVALGAHAIAIPPATLSTACAEGSGADREARVDPDDLVLALATERKQLQGFRRWLRATAPASASTARESGSPGASAERIRSDARNARLFVDFLVGTQGVPVRAVSEYDLRVFLHDWLHRKVVLPDEEAFEVPGSLRRFFDYLASKRDGAVVCAWAEPVLADIHAFRVRRRTVPNGFFWDDAVQEWRAAATAALVSRALVPEAIDSDADTLPRFQGQTEWRLTAQLQRLWLVWRDDIIRGGNNQREAVIEALIERQARWETSPNPLAGGIDPRTAVRAERALSPAAPGF